MQKLQSGLVIEFYSNSCLVRTDIGDIKCLAIKNIVVGDKVSIELIQDSKEAKGIIVSREQRNSFLEKRDGIKSKAVAANISHVGILITPEPITSTEFIDKWLLTAHSSGITPFIINNKIDLKSKYYIGGAEIDLNKMTINFNNKSNKINNSEKFMLL